MSFGVYFHIPYCLQRCSYCDFATYEKSQILPPENYVELVKKEIHQKLNYFSERKLDTIYFGGGTPSLLPPQLILSLIEELEKNGFSRGPETEVTLEINPATLTPQKIESYLKSGFNRFSVGAQTFDDALLKMVKREHNAQQTLDTLKLLRDFDVNFNFDILFALPTQTVDGLKRDLEIALNSGARHISPYCLTVPEGHPLSKNRPLEEDQLEMFELLRLGLTRGGFEQYEISNFAQPGFESKHNTLYWADQEYWGLGLSSHSYSKASSWGTRFWNVNSIHEYEKQIEQAANTQWASVADGLASSQYEVLNESQALTDFCHTSLRMMSGLNSKLLQNKFSPKAFAAVEVGLNKLMAQGLIQQAKGLWSLTPQGIVLSNRVFYELAFLKEDLGPH
ncbi:MAG: radical SAM family heme chaperone HemW [Bdellovibrionota bacterium]